MKLTVHPATPARWPDLEAVFNARGCAVARGCWCMYYRRSGNRPPLPPNTTHAQANRAELKALVEAYPVDRPGRASDDTLWFGSKSMYDKAGFVEVARRKPQRPVVRIVPA